MLKNRQVIDSMLNDIFNAKDKFKDIEGDALSIVEFYQAYTDLTAAEDKLKTVLEKISE